ncbi:hypothetical protein ACGFWD_41135 [Streptomyces sp. NPDC048448]|uniref:hypothetical protein n=1 Tax=unclassified Streptomyces TaxID=2593676 RepID=UPI00341D6EC5
MSNMVPGDLVRIRVIGGKEETESLLKGLAADGPVAERLSPIPAIDVEPGGSFGVIEAAQDFIVGVGGDLAGAALSAIVRAAVARIRGTRDEPATNDATVNVTVHGDGVTEVVIRLDSHE